MFHGRICVGEFCPSVTGDGLLSEWLCPLRPEGHVAWSLGKLSVRVAFTVVSPIPLSCLPAICDLGFPEIEVLSFHVTVPAKTF